MKAGCETGEGSKTRGRPQCRSSSREGKPRIVVILAGGRSRRMGGVDKARAELAGARLVDRVIDRLRPQAGRLLISGVDDYGTGLQSIPDCAEGPPGPAGGVFAGGRWARAFAPETEQFFTVPVDGPFLPSDLISRLADAGGTAIASDGENDHPTFACWRLDAIEAAWPMLAGRASVSLKALAEACAAVRVVWSDQHSFLNLNTPEDFACAGQLIAP